MVAIHYFCISLFASLATSQDLFGGIASIENQLSQLIGGYGKPSQSSSLTTFVKTAKPSSTASSKTASSVGSSSRAGPSSSKAASASSLPSNVKSSSSAARGTASSKSSSVSASTAVSFKSASSVVSSGFVKSSSKSTPSGCPPVTTSTVTYTTTSFTPIYTGTTSFTLYYVPTSTTTLSSTLTITSTSSLPLFTSYYSTATTTVVSRSTADSVTTVATSPGFTPVLCGPAYFNPTTNVTSVSTYSTWSRSYISIATTTATSSSYLYTSTVTASATSVRTTYVISTVTSILPSTVSTVYAACASNNIAKIAPDGEPFYSVGTIDTTFTSASAVDIQACCELCQTTTNCEGSSFELDGNPRCALFIGNSCNATQVGETAIYGGTDRSVWAVSNSGCGQFAPRYQVFINGRS